MDVFGNTDPKMMPPHFFMERLISIILQQSRPKPTGKTILFATANNDSKKRQSRKILGWFAGIIASIISGLLLWWLTQTPHSPLVQDRFGVSVKRDDYSSIIEQQHETVCFLKNTGIMSLNSFSLELRVWEWQEIINHKLDMYGDPKVCRLADLGKHQHGYHMFLYKCSIVNPGEELVFSVKYYNSYYIKNRQTYTPGRIQVLSLIHI